MSRFVPSFENYTVQALESFSEKELRKEYSRMRDTAQKRVKRLQKEFPKAKASQKFVQLRNEKGEIVKEYVGFRELKDIDSRDLPKALSELAKFVKAKTSTVTGQRNAQRKTMATLNRAIGAGSGGQAAVTKENYWRVIDILEEARKRKIVYGSDKVVTLAEASMVLSDAQFEDILNNLEKLKDHVDEFEGSLEEYMDSKDIEGYQKVDMDDFIKELGW